MLPPSPFGPETTRAVLVGLGVAFVLVVMVHEILDGSDVASYVKAARRRRKEREAAKAKAEGGQVNNKNRNISKESRNVVND